MIFWGIYSSNVHKRNDIVFNTVLDLALIYGDRCLVFIPTAKVEIQSKPEKPFTFPKN